MNVRISRLAAFFFIVAHSFTGHAQGTAFTYQGSLSTRGSGGGPANGSFDFSFSLYSTVTNGVPVMGPVTNLATPVSNGLFTVSIDFGAVFTGSNYWLDIAVRSNGGPTFVELTPRQAISSTPYAIMARSASGLSGTLPATQLSGVISTTQLPAAAVTNGQANVLYVDSVNRGALTLTSNSPADIGNLYLPDNSSIIFPSGAISDEQNHGPASGQMEFAINAVSRLETSWGSDAHENNAWQIGLTFRGGPQGPASPAYWNADNWSDSSGTNFLGYGLMEERVVPYTIGSGSFLEYILGYRSEAKTTNGLFALTFYNVQNQNALIGQSPGPEMGLEIWNNGVVFNGRETRSFTPLRNTTNYGVSFDTNLDVEIDTVTNISFTNLPDTYARTNQRDTATITIFNGFNPVSFSTPTNWIWGSATTNLPTTPSNLPPFEVAEINVKRKIGRATSYFATATFYPNTQFAADHDAANFFAASGITDGTIKTAVNQFVISLKNAGLWSRWDCIYPLVGGTSNTCSWNLANPGAYRIAWAVGASTFAANGWTSDGSASFANTGFNPHTAVNPNYSTTNATLLFYNGTSFPTGVTPAYFIGATFTNRAGITEFSAAGFGVDGFNVNSGEANLAAALPAPFNGTIAYTTSSFLFSALTPTGSYVRINDPTGVPEVNFYFGARNGSGSVSDFIGARFGLVMIGGNITGSEYAELTNIVGAFEGQLSRQ